MTSNLGSDLIRKSTEVGFGVDNDKIDYDTMKDKIDKAVKKHFKPEFINRLDGTVIFRAFDKDHLVKVIDLEVSKLQKRLDRKHIKLILSKEAKDYIVEKGYQPEMGARPLRRAVEQELEDPLAEMLLRNPNLSATFHVVLKNGALLFEMQEEEKKESEETALAVATPKKRKKEPSN
jgi:ATP-dependent Clp protease ATP-binding subunit ClpC